jgi:hypothetical protein
MTELKCVHSVSFCHTILAPNKEASKEGEDEYFHAIRRNRYRIVVPELEYPSIFL